MNSLANLICHRRADRALWIGRWRSPLCARCTAFYVALFAGFLVGIPFALSFIRGPAAFLFLGLALLPLALDGITQAMRGRESTTLLRVATGCLAGVAVGLAYEGVLLG